MTAIPKFRYVRSPKLMQAYRKIQFTRRNHA